jgi:hypothetical protein
MLIFSLVIAILLCYFTGIMPVIIMFCTIFCFIKNMFTVNIFLVAVILTFIFALPNGIITALTNMTLS